MLCNAFRGILRLAVWLPDWSVGLSVGLWGYIACHVAYTALRRKMENVRPNVTNISDNLIYTSLLVEPTQSHLVE
jgi:hypothetical protein